MSDVLQTAVKYRNRLRAELSRLEEFLRLAEDLTKESDPEARLAATRSGLGGQKGEAKMEGGARPGQNGTAAVA
jgi:hypothetical protein